MNDRAIETTIQQTLDRPILSIGAVKEHAKALAKLVEWEEVGILIDNAERPSAVLIVLLLQDKVVAVCRHCLPPMDSVRALQAYAQNTKAIELRCCQAYKLLREDLTDLSSLSSVWQQTHPSIISLREVQCFFERLDRGRKDRGKQQNISKSTRQRVLLDAHGRCMFVGCGKDLNLDPITGTSGNIAYLAHNIATSVHGPRGDINRSYLLADEPSNILLLCDVHHRLIDFVARTDYSVDRLRDHAFAIL